MISLIMISADNRVLSCVYWKKIFHNIFTRVNRWIHIGIFNNIYLHHGWNHTIRARFIVLIKVPIPHFIVEGYSPILLYLPINVTLPVTTISCQDDRVIDVYMSVIYVPIAVIIHLQLPSSKFELQALKFVLFRFERDIRNWRVICHIVPSTL